MIILIFGLLLWALTHLSLCFAPAIKINISARIGALGFKMIFALVILLSLYMITLGWKNTVPEFLYQLPNPTRHLAMLLIFIALGLFIAGRLPTRLNNFIRHPQLSSVILWSIAHLLLNGDTRSVIVFSGLGLWALAEMFFINKRDGIWQKKASTHWQGDAIMFFIAMILFIGLLFAHPYLSGVRLIN